MKTKIYFSLVALLFVFGCSNDEDILMQNSSSSILKSASQSVSKTISENALKSAAQVYKYQETADYSDSLAVVQNLCKDNSYFRIMQGIMHIDLITSVNGNRYTTVNHSNFSNFKLLDEETGNEYIGNYTYNSTYTGNIVGGMPIVSSGTIMFLLTTPGNGDNVKYQVDYQTTINANGETKVEFYNEKVNCQ